MPRNVEVVIRVTVPIDEKVTKNAINKMAKDWTILIGKTKRGNDATVLTHTVRVWYD